MSDAYLPSLMRGDIGVAKNHLGVDILVFPPTVPSNLSFFFFSDVQDLHTVEVIESVFEDIRAGVHRGFSGNAYRLRVEGDEVTISCDLDEMQPVLHLSVDQFLMVLGKLREVMA